MKPPKGNEKRQKKFRFKESGNRAPQNESKDGDKGNNKNIYGSMARMSGNDEIYSRYFGDSSQ